MYDYCCVDNCVNKRQDVKLHQFPADVTASKKWLEYINSDRLRNIPSEQLQKSFVCHKHFERRFLTKRNRIVLGGYPTLFSQEEYDSGVPRLVEELTQADLIKTVTLDHCYHKRLRQHEEHTYAKPYSSDAAGSSLEQHPEVRQNVQCAQDHPTVSGSSASPKSQTVLREIQNLPEQPGTSTTLVQPFVPALTEEQPAISGVMVEHHISNRKRNWQRQNPHQLQGTENSSGTSKRRKRLVRKLADLPPHCRRIYDEFKKSTKQLDFMKRAKRAIKFANTPSFERLTSNLNPLAKKIIWMQITQSKKKLKGRRFTDEEKMVSLAILKQSPKAYKFLQKIFILPSRNTLSKLTSSLNVQPGINNQVFEAIKNQVQNWDEKKKYCSIIFDEVSLEPGVDYDKNKDQLNGFVHLGKKTNQLADHALVFMLRGAIHKWQQPIAYYFCEGSTRNEELRVILKNVINAVIETGLIPVAVICDQGQSFQSALKALLEETRRDQITTGKPIDDVITLKGRDISVIFDPPHLVKGIRNNFLAKNMKFNEKICKWSDIVDVYQTDCEHAEVRLLHKLNDAHVLPEKINKMKVKTCTRVLSKTMAAALSYTSKFSHYSDGKPVSETLKNTSEAVSFYDDLFDSCNGATCDNKGARGKQLRKAVTATSQHHAFWCDAIKKLESTKFVDERRGEISVPSIKNWIVTLKSYMRLWQFFKNKGVKIMRPRYFNSDPIENFFGQVRAYNFRSNDPDCHSFMNTFKSLLITRIINFHSAGFNCEEENTGAQLINIKKMFEEKENLEPETSSSPCNLNINYDHGSVQAQVHRERLNVHSRAYTAGWVVRKIFQNIKCKKCFTDLTAPNEGPCHGWISEREYNVMTKKRLSYPSEYVVRSFGDIVKESNEYLERQPHVNNISGKIKTHIICKYSFDFLNCATHKPVVLDLFLGIVIRFAIFNWCNTINKILKGTDIHRLSKPLPLMQEKALNKCNKRFKNKRKLL